MIKHELHRVPVTALAFSEDHLFAGEGPFLKIHRRHDKELLVTRRVFASQAVHGVVVRSDRLIIWGGRYVAVYDLDLKEDPLDLEQVSYFEATDWLLDVSISPDDQRAALITAQNALLMLDLELDNGKESLRDLTSNSKCILYSAHLHWVNSGHILIASGTVFGEIIVWSCKLDNHPGPISVLHHVLTGHEGSIFGVQVFDCSASENDNQPSRLLASCSDDRTVRIWDISTLPETPTNPQTAADLPSARETGFGANIADVLPDGAAAGHCIAQAWGHLSRIWGVKFVPSQDTDHLSYLVSFGEDATSQFWGLEASGPDSYVLRHLRSSSSHSGKNIWSWAITQESKDKIIVATGGADGGIALEPRNVPFEHESDAIQTWSIQDLVLACPRGEPTGRQDKLRNYAFVNQNDLLVTTNAGHVLLVSLLSSEHQNNVSENSQIRWLSTEPSLRGYSVVTSLPSLGLAFMAGIDGTVLIHDRNGVRELVKSVGKTTALFAQQLTSHHAAQTRVSLLIANVENKTSMLLCFNVEETDNISPKIENISQWQVSMPTEFILTASLIVDGIDRDSKLVLGSRKGSIAMFSLRNLEQDAVIGKHDLLLDRAHGTDAITDFAWVSDVGSEAKDGYIFSVGRDGTYAIHRLPTSTSSSDLHLINQTNLPLGMIVEGVRVDEATEHVQVWGFYRKKFVLIDMTDEKELMTVDCGGANRDWKFEPLPDLRGGRFAWTKASQLCLVSQTEQPSQAIGGGSHGREIKAVAVSPSNLMNDSVLISTGSEDTDIKIFTCQERDKRHQFRCLRTLRLHNTGIRKLEWSSDGRYLFSSGGFEEFFVWRIQSVPHIGLGVFCESVCPTESALPDLRIMGFSVIPLQDTKSFIISIVRSDSTIRVYRYTPGLEKKWHMLMAGTYMTSCLTECLHLGRANGTSSLITGGTDGYIAFWPLDQADLNAEAPPEPDAVSWTSRFKIHQNTIHCMKIHWLDDVSCILLTGGDDNAVAISRCSWAESRREPNVDSLIIPRAHAAAVTGLEVLQYGQSTILLASTSIDQRVKTWEIDFAPSASGIDGITVKRQRNEFTAVADVSSLALLERTGNSNSIIVCGVGMDVWSNKR